ncbi:MAG: putative signal transducing protein [Planctomycetota bacterium]|jgi:hypothetical protein
MSESGAGQPEGLREIYRAKDLFEARLVAGFLQSHEIQTHIPNEYTLDTYDGMATLWSKGVPIHVPLARFEEARRLLAEREKARESAEEESEPPSEA